MAQLGHLITSSINAISSPGLLFTISCVLFYLILFKWRDWFGKKSTLYILLGSLAAFIALSMLNETFRAVVAKPDNVPIVGMLFLLLFFTWLPIHIGNQNDKLIEEGKDVVNKKEAKELVFTWPDLVMIWKNPPWAKPTSAGLAPFRTCTSSMMSYEKSCVWFAPTIGLVTLAPSNRYWFAY